MLTLTDYLSNNKHYTQVDYKFKLSIEWLESLYIANASPEIIDLLSQEFRDILEKSLYDDMNNNWIQKQV